MYALRNGLKNKRAYAKQTYRTLRIPDIHLLRRWFEPEQLF
jgi:hypothetical protein